MKSSDIPSIFGKILKTQTLNGVNQGEAAQSAVAFTLHVSDSQFFIFFSTSHLFTPVICIITAISGK